MFDRYQDVLAEIDRRRAEPNEPPSHRTAREQLDKAGIAYQRIVRAEPEAILFVNQWGRAMTAWSEVRPSGSVVFYCQAGMPAFPSAYLGER